MREDLPERMHFETSNRRYLVLACVGAFFVIALTVMRMAGYPIDAETNVWLTVLFATVTLIGAIAALTQRAWLKLHADGFETSELRGMGRIAWQDVSELRLHSPHRPATAADSRVAFDFRDADDRMLTRAPGTSLKGSILLSEDYRIRTRELVTLMNAFRQRALVTGGGLSLSSGR